MTELRSWQDTEAARMREKLGAADPYRSGEEIAATVDAYVAQADREYRSRLGRSLTPDEADMARRQAHAVAPGGFSSPMLHDADLRGLGFGIMVAPRPENTGIAVMSNGVWSGDQDVARRAQAAQADRRAWQDAADGFARGPAGGVAGASY